MSGPPSARTSTRRVRLGADKGWNRSSVVEVLDGGT
jgi:hypothetical protein